MVIDEDGKEAIVTSQPFVPGEASTDEEVAAFMAERGFAVVPQVVAGRRGSVSYFRESDHVAVFDKFFFDLRAKDRANLMRLSLLPTMIWPLF